MQKATSQGQLLKVQQREREFIERTLYNQTNLSMKKKHLHGKQLDKQKVAKRNPEI